MMMKFGILLIMTALSSYLVDGASSVSPLRIDGLVTAVFSPFDVHQNLNVSVVPEQAKYLNETGVDWVFVGGTTGESLSLTKDERKTLSQAWVDTGLNVIVHVGSDAIGDAIELAQHAESIGAKAIGAMPPVFFKPANAQALALTISTICAAVPNLPCYYYHIPSMTGYAQPMYDFVEAIAPLSDNFCGIKYTGLYTAPGFMDAQRVMNFDNGKYEVLGGREELMIEALALGIKGFVGSQFNVAGDLYNQLHSKFESEGLTKDSMDELRSIQYAGVELISAWQGAVGVGMNGNKALMNLAGVPVGPGRLPSLPVDDKTVSTLKSSLESFCKSHADLKLRACASSFSH